MFWDWSHDFHTHSRTFVHNFYLSKRGTVIFIYFLHKNRGIGLAQIDHSGLCAMDPSSSSLCTFGRMENVSKATSQILITNSRFRNPCFHIDGGVAKGHGYERLVVQCYFILRWIFSAFPSVCDLFCNTQNFAKILHNVYSQTYINKLCRFCLK